MPEAAELSAPVEPGSGAVRQERYDKSHAEILERMDEGFYTIDRDWRLTYVNRSAERFWGLSRQELLGRDMRTVFTRFVGSQSHAAHELAMLGGEDVRVETYSSATGAPIELRLFPDLFGLTVYFRDITQQRRLEDDLRGREAMLTLAERSAGVGVWTADLESQTVRGTAQFFQLLGLEPTDQEVAMEIPLGVRHPEDRERVFRGFLDAIAAGSDSYETEYRIMRNDEVRWIFGRGLVTRDSSGTPVRYSGVDIDITERKGQEDQVRTVLQELQHRTNNMLAVVQAMARQTSRRSATLSDFIETFSERLQSLSHSNRLLVEENWRGSRLDELIRRQLLPFMDAEAGRLELTGPPIMLKPEAVHTVGLAFHELATNATKYGALSVASGRIGVTWQIEGVGDERRCVLTWRETGGPRVRNPTRSGFGRYVTEKMVGHSLGGPVKVEFAREGVVWTAEIPQSQMVSMAGAWAAPIG